MPEKHAAGSKPENRKSKGDFEKAQENDIEGLRALAHDLSNSLEAIMQASYLLSQAKLDREGKRWAQLLQVSSDEAAKINREIRKRLRAMSED